MSTGDAGVDPIIVGMADGAHPYAHALESRGYRILENLVRFVPGLIVFRRVLRRLGQKLPPSIRRAVSMPWRSFPRRRGVLLELSKLCIAAFASTATCASVASYERDLVGTSERSGLLAARKLPKRSALSLVITPLS